jgi:hypothetical protein
MSTANSPSSPQVVRDGLCFAAKELLDVLAMAQANGMSETKLVSKLCDGCCTFTHNALQTS